MLQQAYGEDCLSRTQCHGLYQRFKLGRTSIEEDPKCGRPSMSMDDDNVEKVLAMIRQKRRPTVREVAEEVGICKRLCHLILTDKLKMRRVAAKFLLCLLTDALLIREFWRRMRRLFSPSRPTLQIWPLQTFSFSEVEILTKRSPISDGRGDRRKFDTRPSRHPTKHVPERIPELEKTLGAVYEEWRCLRWRR